MWHLGVQKTLEKIQERFYWVGTKRDIYNWILSCDKCSLQKKPQQNHRRPLTVWKPSNAFLQVALDIMRPLPESDGFKYILLIGDQFSKWYEAVPMQNQEAKTVAISFVDCWVSRLGCPANLRSDKGTDLMSNLFKNMYKGLGIDRLSKTPYHPQVNAMIERTNRTIEEILAKYVGEQHSTLSKYLQVIMMTYRSSVHTVTKYSPYYLLFGAPCALPIDSMYKTLQNQIFVTPSDYICNLKKEVQLCHELVRLNMEVEQERQKTYYDRKQFGPKYQTGDLVLLFNPTVKPGQTKKFKSYYSGPLVIREIIIDLNFIIEDLKTQKQQKVHYYRPKKFKFRQHKYQKQSKLAKRPVSNEEKEDSFIEIEVEQQGS